MTVARYLITVVVKDISLLEGFHAVESSVSEDWDLNNYTFSSMLSTVLFVDLVPPSTDGCVSAWCIRMKC